MKFDLQPTLSGEHLSLRPLRSDDGDAIFGAASDPLIWEQHPARNRHIRSAFDRYFDDRLRSGGTLLIIDRLTGAVIGWSSYGNYDAALNEVEIGWTFLTRAQWGGATNRELKSLMLAHAFRFVETVVFRIAKTNVRSQRATAKIGGVLIDRPAEIIFEGVKVDHLVYAVTKEAFAASACGRTVDA